MSINIISSPGTTLPIMEKSPRMRENRTDFATPEVRQRPAVIPVYEEVDEDVSDPRMHPMIFAMETTSASKIDEPEIDTTMESAMILDDGESGKSTTTSSETEPRREATTMESSTISADAEALSLLTAGVDIASVQSMPGYSKCAAGQFQCVNGTSRDGAYCVGLSAKCDSEKDCSDGSDEELCEEENCQGNFQCKSGQCLRRHLVCNGIKDCGDGSDELECSEWACNFDEFKCPSGEHKTISISSSELC